MHVAFFIVTHCHAAARARACSGPLQKDHRRRHQRCVRWPQAAACICAAFACLPCKHLGALASFAAASASPVLQPVASSPATSSACALRPLPELSLILLPNKAFVCASAAASSPANPHTPSRALLCFDSSSSCLHLQNFAYNNATHIVSGCAAPARACRT